MKKEHYKIKNLDCAHCAVKIENHLKSLDCTGDVSLNFASQSLTIETDDILKVETAIHQLEPDVELLKFSAEHVVESGVKKNKFIVLGISFLVLLIGIFYQEKLHEQFEIIEYVLFLGLYFLSGHSVLWKAFRNLLQGKVFDENFLMSIATLGAVFIHALPEAAGVMIFYRIGELLEQMAVHRSRSSIRSLLAIKPDKAHLKTIHGLKTVTPEKVALKDRIVVKPGERVPLDGVVIAGESLLDTSALTGESVPFQVQTGMNVLAGSIVQTGTLTLRVEKTAGESSISRILDIVENALQKKSRTDRFITRFARYYTPAIVLISSLTAIAPPLLGLGSFTDWLYRALVILVISCPCALVISIPLGYFGGIGRASHDGILIKGSNFLDLLPKVKTVMFDKTGTLTKGTFEVTAIHPRNGFQREELLKWAAYAEFYSNHPIAVAVRRAYQDKIIEEEILNHEEYPGYGVKAMLREGNILVGNDRFLHREKIEHQDCHQQQTTLYVVLNGQYAGYMTISDEEKENAGEMIQMLKKEGVQKTVMLTGDNREVAEYYREKLQLDQVYAELLPEEKVKVLEQFREKQKNRVAFLGDGINDAPVIARADVGLSMGKGGSDAAIETADIVLMTDDLLKLPKAFRIGRMTHAIVWQNIILTLLIKFLFVTFGAFGLANMWEAVFADVGVTLLAVLNSLRILKVNKT